MKQNCIAGRLTLIVCTISKTVWITIFYSLIKIAQCGHNISLCETFRNKLSPFWRKIGVVAEWLLLSLLSSDWGPRRASIILIKLFFRLKRTFLWIKSNIYFQIEMIWYCQELLFFFWSTIALFMNQESFAYSIDFAHNKQPFSEWTDLSFQAITPILSPFWRG